VCSIAASVKAEARTVTTVAPPVLVDRSGDLYLTPIGSRKRRSRERQDRVSSKLGSASLLHSSPSLALSVVAAFSSSKLQRRLGVEST
jgi:hypothetical protein